MQVPLIHRRMAAARERDHAGLGIVIGFMANHDRDHGKFLSEAADADQPRLGGVPREQGLFNERFS